MTVSGIPRYIRIWFHTLVCLSLYLAFSNRIWGQDAAPARNFSQSKISVERVLRLLQPFTAGRLPTLEGFASTGTRPLERFQRGYYQCTVEVKSDPSGGSQVHVSARITAWYAAPDASHSGYQVLPSNGRLEADLLDRLQDALAEKASVSSAQLPVSTPNSAPPAASSAPTMSAPMPRIPLASLHGALSVPFPSSRQGGTLAVQTDAAEKHEKDLAAEAKNLEEVLQNQARPNNLVSVKKDGTPVLQSARLDAPLLFAASAKDEFEILDFTADWVHVRVSGLSRGWIRRAGLEMPEANGGGQAAHVSTPASSVSFRVTGQQFAPFPGDWSALRGKTVTIISIVKIGDAGKNAGPSAKLEFAKALFNKEYAAASSTSDGIVLIFDSDDGGMVAATVQSLQQWASGKLSDEAFWGQCFFDPPEILGTSLN